MTPYLFVFFYSISALFSLEPVSFQEIWGYLMRGEESTLTEQKSITDVAYFSASITETGRLSKVPTFPPSLRKGKRVHLVVNAPGNRSLMYWCLSKDLETRKLLIQDILAASKDFDGIQIDFEVLRKEEAAAFYSFLQEVKANLSKEKCFSVALPARTSKREDPFPYKEIAAIADRVVIMAYDEHYGGGSAGAIASLAWCKRVLHFAKQEIPEGKLIMGLPLYGRVWQKQKIASALKYPQTLALWKEFPKQVQRLEDGTAYFSFQKKVDLDVYFEDEQSLYKKLSTYEKNQVRAVALWRLSQEPISLWRHLYSKKIPFS